MKKELKEFLQGGLKQKNEMMNILVEDVLKKNGVDKDSLRNLPDSQKNQIKKVAQDVQRQINELLK
ncbi:spore coat protein [Bacillus fonticola]|uniref:spore coat protein n=1 Tax=Bacillus fonticola TaxID=2728853 RepID=UPI0014755534|nr:spore coat protein [Bacillus fonticola]